MVCLSGADTSFPLWGVLEDVEEVSFSFLCSLSGFTLAVAVAVAVAVALVLLALVVDVVAEWPGPGPVAGAGGAVGFILRKGSLV